MRLFTTLWVMPNLAPTSRSESPSKKIACISSCSLSDSKGRAAFSLSTMTALTTVSAMSTASSVIKSRGFPSLSVNPSRDSSLFFVSNFWALCQIVLIESLSFSQILTLMPTKRPNRCKYTRIDLKRLKTQI